jgi:hypothetical protein
MKKDVYIDNSKKLVMVNGKVIPRLLLSIIRGAIGKSFVVKRYRGRRMVVTRFPDMSGIVATEKQRVRRDLFREAVVFGKWIIADEARKLAFKNTLPRKKRRKVYQAALQMYIREKGNKMWLRKVLQSIEQQWIGICSSESNLWTAECLNVRRKLALQAMERWQSVEVDRREAISNEHLSICIQDWDTC